MLTPEQIAYIREWVASGNEPRDWMKIILKSLTAQSGHGPDGEMMVRLSDLGLTVAALAEENERLREALAWAVHAIEADGHPSDMPMVEQLRSLHHLKGDP